MVLWLQTAILTFNSLVFLSSMHLILVVRVVGRATAACCLLPTSHVE